MHREYIKLGKIWEGYVVCMKCGELFKELNSHLRNIHNQTCREYLSEYPGFPVVSDLKKQSISGRNNPNYKSGKKIAPRYTGEEGKDFVLCYECGKKVRMITTSGHLRIHGMTREEYITRNPGSKLTCQDFDANRSPVANFLLEDRIRYSTENSHTRKNYSMTKPHKRVCSLLKELGLKYENEVLTYGKVIDIKIDDRHYIEVQGNYWHCNPVMFDTPSEVQSNKIRLDTEKCKKFNEFGINILYLWENDIMNRYVLCKDLILRYMGDQLSDYHSFNYENGAILKDCLLKFYY